MPKKPVTTYHPLAVIRSLEKQNEQASAFCMAVHNLLNFPDVKIPDTLRNSVRDAMNAYRNAMWPEE